MWGWLGCVGSTEPREPSAEPLPLVEDRSAWRGRVVDGRVVVPGESVTVPAAGPDRDVTVLRDAAGRPAYLVTEGWLTGVNGAEPPVPQVTDALLARWSEGGVDGPVTFDATLRFGAGEAPFSITLADGALTPTFPDGLAGRLWTREDRWEGVLEGAGGAVFLTGRVGRGALRFDPVGTWFADAAEARASLDAGCVPQPELSFELRHEDGRVDARVAHLGTQSEPTGDWSIPLGGEAWTGAGGAPIDPGGCFHRDDGTDQCWPWGEGLKAYQDKLAIPLGPRLWDEAGADGLAGTCHPPVKYVLNLGGIRGVGIRPVGAPDTEHAAAAAKATPCTLHRIAWTPGECRPIGAVPAPAPGGWSARRAGPAEVEVDQAADGIHLTGPQAELVVPYEAVSPSGYTRLFGAERVQLVFDAHGAPGWLAVAVGGSDWWRVMALADHPEPTFPLAPGATLADPAVPVVLTGQVTLLAETVPVTVTLGAETRVAIDGLPPDVTASASTGRYHPTDADLSLWLTTPRGAALLRGGLAAIPDRGAEVTFGPVPGAVPDRKHLIEVMNGACWDGAVLGDPTRWRRLGVGAFQPNHPAVAHRDSRPPYRQGEWHWGASAAPAAYHWLGELDQSFDRHLFGASSSPEVPTVMALHRCGEPAPTWDSGPTRTVTVKIESEDSQLWIDNRAPMPGAPVLQVELPVDVYHEFTLGSRSGFRSTSQLVTATEPAEICFADDGACDGVSNPPGRRSRR